MAFSYFHGFLVIAAYLLGSIPFGIQVASRRGVDIRKVGSGNTGATNVFRSVSPGAGVLVFILDMAKCAIPVSIASYWGVPPLVVVFVGSAGVLGHIFSPFLRFKGGRGSAPALGFLLGIAPDIFLVTFIFVGLVISITRYVSVGSLCGTILVSVLMFAMGKPDVYAWVAVVMTVIIWIRHIPNVRRLLAGKENKIW